MNPGELAAINTARRLRLEGAELARIYGHGATCVVERLHRPEAKPEEWVELRRGLLGESIGTFVEFASEHRRTPARIIVDVSVDGGGIGPAPRPHPPGGRARVDVGAGVTA